MDDDALPTSIADEDKYRHSSSRSQTVVNDANAPIDNDGRTKTNTYFYPSEGDPKPIERFGYKRDKWEWLNELQEGRYGYDNNERISPAQSKRDLRTWMNQLHCQDHQIEWACQIYDSTPTESSAAGYVGGHKNEAVLLSIVTLVLNADVNRKVRDEDHFQDLRESCGVRKEDIRIVRKKLRPLL